MSSPKVPAVPVDPVRADLRNFVYLVWQHLGLPKPTPIQYDICLYLQHGPDRRIIEAFRGVGKSWLTSAYVLWLLHRDPQEKIFVVSASKSKADEFAVFTRKLIEEMPLLHYLKPQQGQRDSALKFDVGPAKAAQAPSVRAVGINGQMTGGRATRIIADDVEVPTNSLTNMMREKLAHSVKEFDAVLSPGGSITYLGTPQCEMSLYNIIPARGYSMRIWPARYPDSTQYTELYFSRLAPFITKAMEKNPGVSGGCFGRGDPTEPTRFHDLDLIARGQSYGPGGWEMQFMLNTSLSDQDRYPLKLTDFMVMDINPEIGPVSIAWGSGPPEVINDLPSVGLEGDRWHRPIFISPDFVPYQGVVMAIDPAGRGGDELGYAIQGHLNGTLFLMDCGGLRGGYADENLQKLADLAKKWKVNQIVIESNFGDAMFTKLLTPFLTRTYPCSIEDINSSKQKELRIIDTIEPVLQQHRFVVDRALIQRDQENYNKYPEDTFNQYQLFYQLTRITKERGALAKDDRADALAMATAYWVQQMDRDTLKVQADHRAALLDLELRDFEAQVFGREPQSTNWCSR